MDNEPKTEPGASPPECKHCKATKNKKGEPWSPMGLLAHQDRHCTQNPARNPAQESSKNPAQETKPSSCAESSTKSTQDSQDATTHTLSLREKREAQPPSEAAAVQEEESVAALWKKYGLDQRENGRQVFTPTDHLYMGVPYNRATVKQKAQRTGVIAKLRAYAHQAAFDEAQAAAEKAQRDSDPAYQRRLALDAEWVAEQKERAARRAAWEAELATQGPVEKVCADTDEFFPPKKDPTAPMDFNNLNERILAQIAREKREKARKANGTRNR